MRAEGGGSELVMCRDDQRRMSRESSSEGARLLKDGENAGWRFFLFFLALLTSPRIPVGDGRDWRLGWCSGTGVSRRKPRFLYLLSRLFLLLGMNAEFQSSGPTTATDTATGENSVEDRIQVQMKSGSFSAS